VAISAKISSVFECVLQKGKPQDGARWLGFGKKMVDSLGVGLFHNIIWLVLVVSGSP
jgi:hypothetical protein